MWPEAEIAECEQAMEKLVDDFDAASVADDDATKELTRRALLKRRDNHRRATTRPQPVGDALAVFEEGLQARTQTRRSRLWQSLSGDLKDAAGEIEP